MKEQMKKEIEGKIALIQEKIDSEEVGSVMHTQWMSIKKELEKQLTGTTEVKSGLRIHRDPNDDICESCQ